MMAGAATGHLLLTHFTLTLMLLDNCQGAIVDMTHPFDENTIYWPGSPEFEFDILVRGQQERGYWYESNNFSTAEHGGTHIDAPVHFYKDKWTVDKIPADRLSGPAAVIDISARAALDPDTEVTVKDIEAWEKQYGELPEGGYLFMNSGWDKHWLNRTAYLGNGEGNTSDLHFPGFHPDAAQWLVDNRKLYAVGVDTPSVDYGQSYYFQAHVNLFKENVFGVENAKNLGMLPPQGATVYCYPFLLAGGSGAPVRLVAMWDTDPANTGSQITVTPTTPLTILIFILSSLYLRY